MTKQLATIDFQEHSAVRSLYGGNFYIPAVPKGAKPFLLTLQDHVQMEKLPHIIGGGRMPVTIFGEHIGIDLIAHWTMGVLGMTGDCGPGIWVVRDTIQLMNDDGIPVADAFGVVQTRPATDEEKKAMWDEDYAAAVARQAKWGEFLIQQGDIYAADPNPKMRLLIGPAMKAAAKYYGREREWLDELKDDDTRLCPFCFKATNPLAPVCQKCDRVIDQAKYDALTKKPAMPPPLNPGEKKQVAA